MNKRKLSILATLLLPLVSVFALLLGPSSALASSYPYPYDPNDLLSDQLFGDYNSMSAGDIQNFLNAKNSGIKSYSDTEDCSSSPRYSTFSSFYNSHYHCNQSESVAQIIYDVAQAYQVSPKVILATLQKEQSLVTDPTAPSSNMTAINCAMGYDSCSDDVGFFHQVDWGTWQLKADVQLMTGNNYWNYTPSSYPCSSSTSLYSDGLYPGRTVTFANPGGTSKTVTLATAPTAALYCYTPYVGPFSETGYSGSYNFVESYEQWWGSTTTGMLTIVHPDGTLVRIANPSYPNVYLTAQSGKAEFGTSAGVLLSNGYNLGTIKSATQDDVTAMYNTDHNLNSPPAQMFYRCGTLIRDASSPTVYVMDGCSSATSQARSLVDQSNFNRLTYNFNSVVTIPHSEFQGLTVGSPYDSSIATHPNGSLVKPANSPTVYLLQPCSTGPTCVNGQQAYSMTSIDYFLSWGFNFNQVEIATNGDLPILSAAGSNAITWFRAGTLVRANNSPTVYIIDEAGAKRSFGNIYNFNGLGYTFNDVMVILPSELPSTDGTGINQY